MSVVDEEFPDQISRGSTVGDTSGAKVIQVDSLQRQRIVRTAQLPASFEIILGDHPIDDLQAIRDHFLAVGGAANVFPFKNPMDYTTAANHRDDPSDTDFLIGTGNGSETEFQLKKTYASGSETYERTITYPESSSVVVSVNGVGTTAFSMGASGVVVMNTAPAFGAIVKAGCEFRYLVGYAADAGRTIRYLLRSAVAGKEAGAIRLEEEVETVMISDRLPFLGSTDWGTLSGNISIDHTQGHLHVFTDTTGEATSLPDPEDIPDGKGHFAIINLGAGNHDINDHNGSLVKTLANDGTEIVLSRNATTGAKTWRAVF